MVKVENVKMPKVELAFATVPSETTKDVKLIIQNGKIWHVSRRRDGIYLVDRNKPKGERDTYLLSDFPDTSVPTDPGFKINPRYGAFTVGFTRGHFEYATEYSDYVQLSNARDFMEKRLHRFRSGSLEFTLRLIEIPEPKQLSLF